MSVSVCFGAMLHRFANYPVYVNEAMNALLFSFHLKFLLTVMLTCRNIRVPRDDFAYFYTHHKVGGRIMKLNAPTQNFWWISVVLAVVGVLSQFVVIPYATAYAFWLVTIGFVLLALSTVLKGM